MKTLFTLMTLLFLTGQLFPQIINYKQLTPPPPANQNTLEFVGVGDGSIDFIDFNNDNNPDIFITGKNNTDEKLAVLYKNLGNGVFDIVPNTPFVPLRNTKTAIGDVNNDGYKDIFIVGSDSLNQARLYLYLNHNGVFVKDTTNFSAYNFGTLFLIDVDNDNDMDLFNSGFANNTGHSVLYINNGSGVFTPSTNNPFCNLYQGSAKIFDADGDGDRDVIFSGLENSAYTNKLFLNNGNNGFTLSTQQFPVTNQSALETCDMDNDNDEDVIITTHTGKTYLFVNNGNAVFSLDSTFGVKPGKYYSVNAADLDGDNDNDLIFSGIDSLNMRCTDIYINNGSGSFSMSSNNHIFPVYISDIDFADIDNDNDLDFMFIGKRFTHDYYTRLFINGGAGVFEAATGSQIIGTVDGDMDFADIDNDNDLDMIVTGNPIHSFVNTQLGSTATTIYENTGNNGFLPLSNTPFDLLRDGSVKFADVNNDGLPDLFLCGLGSDNHRQSKLYINNGSGNFTLKTDSTFTPVRYSSVDFADIDNDNDLDMVLSGETHDSYPYLDVVKLYKNDGSGNFTEVNNTNLPQYRFGKIKFADFDNDNDMDLILSGYNNGTGGTLLYKNDGSGNFSPTPNQAFFTDFSHDICVKDIDGDNDLDIILLNQITLDSNQVKIYLNAGNAVFSTANNYSFNHSGFKPTNITMADADKDGDPDLIVNGYLPTGDYHEFSEILLNNGSGQFTPVNKTFFEGMSRVINFKTMDINGDGYDDIFINGKTISGYLSAKIYVNNSSGLGFSTVNMNKGEMLKVYPNPAKDLLNIKLSNPEGKIVKIRIINLLGQSVLEVSGVNSYKTLINTSNLNKGTYLIEVISDNDNYVQKLIIR